MVWGEESQSPCRALSKPLWARQLSLSARVALVMNALLCVGSALLFWRGCFNEKVNGRASFESRMRGGPLLKLQAQWCHSLSQIWSSSEPARPPLTHLFPAPGWLLFRVGLWPLGIFFWKSRATDQPDSMVSSLWPHLSETPKKELFLVFPGGTRPSSFLPPILEPCAFFQVYPHAQNDAPACLNTPSPSASILQARSRRKLCNHSISGPAWG